MCILICCRAVLNFLALVTCMRSKTIQSQASRFGHFRGRLSSRLLQGENVGTRRDVRLLRMLSIGPETFRYQPLIRYQPRVRRKSLCPVCHNLEPNHNFFESEKKRENRSFVSELEHHSQLTARARTSSII